jgi:three-Cys-motif partner protein
MREWPYWTRNKLEILGGYLSAFNQASAGKSSERIYIDLMAGEPFNRDAQTRQEFDGSARLALSASPEFTRLAFCELPTKAAVLRADLQGRFPGRLFRVYPGDCNETIDRVLADLGPWKWAPTFAFADQHAAEIHWDTLCKLADFRAGPRKAEIWLLTSPAETVPGVAGSNAAAFADRVDALYGNRNWRRIQAAREAHVISAAEYRDEMVNLMRWRLENSLGYQMTARIPMRMPSGMPIYDMIFATDHPVGNKIMTHLYRRAAERNNEMLKEVRVRAKEKRDAEAGQSTLFDLDPATIQIETLNWEPTVPWDPTTRPWW